MNLETLQKNPNFLDVWNIAAPTLITEVMDGAVNRVFKIETPQHNYFLRVYKTTDPAVIRREHSLIKHVREANVPAIAPLATLNGETVVLHQNKFCALYPEAFGVQLKRSALNLADAKAAGEALAHVHLATQDLPNTGYRIYGLSWQRDAWIERLNSIEALIEQRENRTDSDLWALRRLKTQRTWLANEKCVHEYKPQFPSQVLHGDYHHGNLFFAAGSREVTVTGIIDWDQAVYMPRAFEVVRAAAYMFDLNSAAGFEFVKAYLALNPLPRAELEDGAKAWGCHSDHYVWAVEEIYVHENERARFFIPHSEFMPFHQSWTALHKRLSQEIYFL